MQIYKMFKVTYDVTERERLRQSHELLKKTITINQNVYHTSNHHLKNYCFLLMLNIFLGKHFSYLPRNLWE